VESMSYAAASKGASL